MRGYDVRVWWTRFARLLEGASGTIVTALAGMIRNKWFALHLDTSGIGVLAQVVSGQALLGGAAGLGLSLPVARAVGAASAPGADLDAGRRAAWTALFLAAVAGAAIAIAGLLFAPFLSTILLGSPDYAAQVRLSMIGVAGMALWLPIQGFFAGRSDIRANLTFAIVSSAGTVVAALFLVPRFGVSGAVTAIAILCPLGIAGILARHARRHAAAIWPRPRSMGAAIRRESGGLLRVGGAALALGLLDLGTMLALRSHYLRAYGVEANGLLQAAIALSQQVGAVFYAYLAAYAFGKINAIAKADGVEGVRAYSRRQWPPLLALAFLAIGASIIAAGPLVHILYSSRFDAARPLMAFALWGEAGRVATQAIALGALAVGGARLWFRIGIVQPLSLALGYVWFERSGAGASSLPLAYAAAGWATFAAALLFMARRRVTLAGRALALTALGAAGLGLLVRWVTA
jgi:O-antigen/teichoic acid export membrane protein